MLPDKNKKSRECLDIYNLTSDSGSSELNDLLSDDDLFRNTYNTRMVENKEQSGILRKARLRKLTENIQIRNEKIKTAELLKIELDHNKLSNRKNKIIDDVSSNASNDSVIVIESSEDIKEKEIEQKDDTTEKNTLFQQTQCMDSKDKQNVQKDLLFHCVINDDDSDEYVSKPFRDCENENINIMNGSSNEEDSIPKEKYNVNAQNKICDYSLFNEDTNSDHDRNGHNHNDIVKTISKKKSRKILQRENSTNDFIVSGSEDEVYEDYGSYLEYYNTVHMEKEDSCVRSLSEKQSMRLYIEYITLCLLSPTLKYDSSFFRISKSIQKVADDLQWHYSQVCEANIQNSSFGNQFKHKEKQKRKEKKRKTKKRKLIKKTLSKSSSDDNIDEDKDVIYAQNGMCSNKLKIRKKKVLTDSDSAQEEYSPPPKQNKEEENSEETILIISDEKTNDDNDNNDKGEGEEDYGYYYANSQESDNQSMVEDCISSEVNYEIGECFSSESSICKEEKIKNYYEIDSLQNSEESENDSLQTKTFLTTVKKKFKEQIDKELLFKILNDKMLEYYVYLRDHEKYSSYDFFKMIHVISKKKTDHDYKQCINKIENHILSKRDQFESHHFKKEFKNILENYANLYEYFEDYLKIPMYKCGCCTRKIGCCCFIFFYAPFYNSKELWNNAYYNFMKVHDFEWLGRIPFQEYSNPLDVLSKEERDRNETKSMKSAIYPFMNTCFENLLDRTQSLLAPIKMSEAEEHVNAILEYIRHEEEITNDSQEAKGPLVKKKPLSNTAINFFINTHEDERKFNYAMDRIFANYPTLYKFYIEKDILLLGLGTQCKYTVQGWHKFHHYKYFCTKTIYKTLFQLYQNNAHLFNEPLLVAYIISKKLYKSFYKSFKNMMNS